MLEFKNEEEFVLKMGRTEVGQVQRKDGRKKGIHEPDYIVRPVTFPINISEYPGTIKLIDFGESFRADAAPTSLRTPLPVRAPEVIFGDELTTSVDLWSAACMVSIMHLLLRELAQTMASKLSRINDFEDI
jgi:serine/threonine protein kinase